MTRGGQSRGRRLVQALVSPTAVLLAGALALSALLWLGRAPAPGPEVELGVVQGPLPFAQRDALRGLIAARASPPVLVGGLLLVLHGLVGGWWFLRRLFLARQQGPETATPGRLGQGRWGAQLETASFEQACSRLPELLAARGYRVRVCQSKKQWLLDGERWELLGKAPALLCLAVALGAAGYVGNARFATQAAMRVGTSEASAQLLLRDPGGAQRLTQLPFALRGRQVRLPPGAAASTAQTQAELCVHVGGQDQGCHALGPGQALDHGGYTFHLAGYWLDPEARRFRIKVGKPGQPFQELRVRIGEALAVEGGGELRPLSYAGDVGGLGPALRLRWRALDAEPQTLLLYERFPEHDARMRGGAYDLRFAGVERELAAVLGVRRLPGTLLLQAALTLLLLSLLGSAVAPLNRCQVQLTRLKSGRCQWRVQAVGRARGLAELLRQDLERMD